MWGILLFNLKRVSAILAALLLPMSLLLFTSSPAQAVSTVRISGVQYDSPGSDTGSNFSLNAEWVRITNYSSSRKSLSGWSLRDTSNHVYRFGTFSLGAGKSVRIHTGSGSNSSTDRYWGSGWYVWNNSGDRATLKNSAGTTVSTRSW
jgi:hypothetical protein